MSKTGGVRCDYCSKEILNNQGVYWAKAGKFEDGIYGKDLDPDSLYYVCHSCSRFYPQSSSIRMPWVWGQLPLKVSLLKKGKTTKLPGSKKTSSDTGYVYLIKSGGRYKIGCSSNIKNRISQLKTGCSYEIELICSVAVKNMLACERKTHKHFAEYRKHGEWFEFPEGMLSEVIGFIKSIDTK